MNNDRARSLRRGLPRALTPWVLAAAPLAWSAAATAAETPLVTSIQRATAQRVAEAGVPLSELSPTAPDSHVVRPGDTLWDISKLFLKSPWRWPELWGMNLQQIRNPHLIYPGQVLTLERSGDRARLRVGSAVGAAGGLDTVKLSPQVRGGPVGAGPIASIPFNLIEPFLNEAEVFQSDALAAAPRIVATQEGRVLLSRGDTAYVRGPLAGNVGYRIFREAKPLRDPRTAEVLGYEARYVGSAEYLREGETRTGADGKPEIVPATFRVTGVRQEANVGDKLAPVPPREFTNYVPHAPATPIEGHLVSIYGDALTAGQNQIVALNRGSRDGVERGHVLALWREGARTDDRTDDKRPLLKLPDERHGQLLVFRVFERVSYALILSVNEPVKPGDRFTQP